MRLVMAPPLGPMGEAVDHASASWRRKTSAPWWCICAVCQRPPRPNCRRRWPGSSCLAQGWRQHAGPTRQTGVRRRLRQLPRLERRKCNFSLRHTHWCAGGQRSRRDKCRPDCDFRDHAADTGGCGLDACVRQRLFRCRNCRGCQLRYRTFWQREIAAQRSGCSRPAKADVPVEQCVCRGGG